MKLRERQKFTKKLKPNQKWTEITIMCFFKFNKFLNNLKKNSDLKKL